MSESSALRLRGIVKRFGATRALDGASCTVRRGEIHALLGENGAGKTTLMRVAFGLTAPDAGTVELDGRVTRFRSTADAIAAGLGMVHQHFMLIPAFTVAENAALAAPDRATPQRMAVRIAELSIRTRLSINPDARVSDLSVGAQQRAEIVRALSHRARILILDEPTSVLTPTEAEELYGWLKRFAADGNSVVLITHKIADALAVADSITVLRHGQTVLEAPRDQVDATTLVRAIVGEAMTASSPSTTPPERGTEASLALHEVSYVDARGVTVLRRASLACFPGDVVGVLGVEGAGHRELLRLLAGRLTPTTGTVTRPSTVGFIPEDRLGEALIPDFSLVENFALAGAGVRRGRMPWGQLADEARAVMAEFDVRAESAAQPIRTLSGGNQQRFVVGRERRIAPAALVAENPTRGLDLRATERMLAEVRAVAGAGGVAVMHSADLDEVLAVATRVVACVGGGVTEVPGPVDPTDRGRYARALVGLAP